MVKDIISFPHTLGLQLQDINFTTVLSSQKQLLTFSVDHQIQATHSHQIFSPKNHVINMSLRYDLIDI